MKSEPGLDLSQLLHLHGPPPPPAAPGQAAAGTLPFERAASQLACWPPPAAASPPLLQLACCVAAPRLLCASAALTQAAAAHQPVTPVNTNLKALALETYTGPVHDCRAPLNSLLDSITPPCSSINRKAWL